MFLSYYYFYYIVSNCNSSSYDLDNCNFTVSFSFHNNLITLMYYILIDHAHLIGKR